MRLHRLPSIVGLALLLILAGCIAHPPAVGPTHQTPGATHSSPESGDCAEWVSFYGLSGSPPRTWAPDQVSIGYTLPGDVSVLFVAFDGDGTVLGTEYESTKGFAHGVTADGEGIQLEEPLQGEHVINVIAYRDVNENEQFDMGTDERCVDENGVVETGPQTINFSRFDAGEDGTPSPGSPTPTQTSTP